MLLAVLYAVATVGLAWYGFRALMFSLHYLWLRWRSRAALARSAPLAAWPTVTVQLPIYNERFVVERLIDAAAALDYPADRLTIQVLDDSTDDTSALARARVAHHRARGVRIDYIQRADRTGYKAGALAHGLRLTEAEFVAVFDADFVPPPGFLRQAMPCFGDRRVGMVQARWSHLNAEFSALTRAQAIMLDGHFGIEQVVRSRTGLLFNFNGSAGIWRAACIADAGGWSFDTIAEDLDLSYRAQLRGWQMRFLPDVEAPAEIPALVGAFKRQQFRWAKGSIQCLRKLGRPLLGAALPLRPRLEGLLHLGSYIVHPLMLVIVMLSLPMLLTGGFSRLHLGAIGLAGLGAPLMFAVAQWSIYPNWARRMLYLPAMVLIGAGMAVNNTWAVIEAVIGRNPTLFLRTPKFRLGDGADGDIHSMLQTYGLPADWTVWAELFFMFYSGLTTMVALDRAPGLAPFMAVYAAGFGYTAYLGLRQSLEIRASGFRSTPRATAQN